MGGFWIFETPVLEIFGRGTLMYIALAVMLRLSPKRHTGNLSPNDMIALVIIASLAADGIRGDAESVPDLLLMVFVVMLWDYLFNLAEFCFPKWRSIAQDSPTLLIHDGVLLKDNLRKEQLTEQELEANLRKRGVEDISRVRQAILETDGHISVLEKSDADPR